MSAKVSAVIAAVVALTVFLGYRDHQVRARDDLRREMVDVAKQGAVYLTTIDHDRVDDDVRRILETSTGEFHDDFAKRAQSFAEAARKAQSTSVGTVTDAAVESVDDRTGRVLVALTVMTSNRGVPETQPRAWRTRVTVADTDDGLKVSQVEFVP
ncbi:MAG: mammalian cell entry protein [Mycobacteriaceae bacterium]